MLQNYLNLLHELVQRLTSYGSNSFSIGNYLEAVLYEMLVVLLVVIHIAVLAIIVGLPVFIVKGSTWLLRNHPAMVHYNALEAYDKDSAPFRSICNRVKNGDRHKVTTELIEECYKFFKKYGIEVERSGKDSKDIDNIVNESLRTPSSYSFYNIDDLPDSLNNLGKYKSFRAMEKSYDRILWLLRITFVFLYILLVIPLVVSFF